MDYIKWSEEYAETAAQWEKRVNMLIQRKNEINNIKVQESIDTKIQMYRALTRMCTNISSQLKCRVRRSEVQE